MAPPLSALEAMTSFGFVGCIDLECIAVSTHHDGKVELSSGKQWEQKGRSMSRGQRCRFCSVSQLHAKSLIHPSYCGAICYGGSARLFRVA